MGVTRDSCNSDIHVLFLPSSEKYSHLPFESMTVIYCPLGKSRALMSVTPKQNKLLLLQLKEKLLT